MLATPAQTAFPPPHFPSEPNHHHHHPTDTDDPFQALHNSLANLSLTAPAHPPPREIPTATAPPDQSPIRATPLFPPGDNVVFAHSSFFRRRCGPSTSSSSSSPPAELPSPAQVRAQAAWLSIAAGNHDGGAGMEMDEFVGEGDGYGGAAGGGGVIVDEQAGAKTVPFAELGLAVRYGPRVSAAEGKAMMFVRRTLGECYGAGDGGGAAAVVVPEVFGWRRDGETGERFVYMALPEGELLLGRWEGMAEREREAVCAQLKGVVAAWRRLRLDGVGFVGSVDNGPLQDALFQGCRAAGAPPPGPFPTVSAFHDYFSSMAAAVSQSRYAGASGLQVQFRLQHLFPDNHPVAFTHGGLHPRNIVVSTGPNPRVVAIIGWEQAGWYPAYWELCKARWDCARHGSLGDWERKYLPWILDADGLQRELPDWSVDSLCQYWGYFAGLLGQTGFQSGER
ncbi:uncharacterized protein THITE_2092788 [Thermothielavioides terrestris NRRL 8126]|uniref:Aminoglycoside phosphotransferase domain-containing protein n=1 Tax=Thermothielavioides terrestris (strain ATCC 38088 / NRRL 8126) TaxID=578455 RepID=G2RHG6_THETT|nr:uncharacterized protein THITE_2092788 [Thermothielavioides terrestris NRRL 8126]AEO71278.1 hypothetical protein THITE_2092788 [Thermothielavioides terrestris NRRL 8126]